VEKTVRQTIKDIVYKHLKENNGQAFGQCLTAVGWVGGTLPELYEEDGMVELSMADVAGGGIVVGSGLMNRRPMYIIRYQGFNWYNSPTIANYACKSKEIWDRPCPIFIRSIAMEGGIGPVAGSSHHSLYYRMPGINIVSPMTPKEYEQAYDWFMNNDEVLYVSEHRGSYDNVIEFQDIILEESDIVLFPISITRFEAEKARKLLENEGLKVSIIHQVWLKPYVVQDSWKQCLIKSKFGGLVLDDDYVDGIARSVAHKLALESKTQINVLGLEDRSAGFSKQTDNLPPNSEKIVEYIRNIIK
jgi:pyruvate/2-oxoglutarate/acetoin dehydrogenase E1 component